jgi:hypothetical protein
VLPSDRHLHRHVVRHTHTHARARAYTCARIAKRRDMAMIGCARALTGGVVHRCISVPLAWFVVTFNWGEHVGLNPLTSLWACCVIGESVTFVLMAGAIGALLSAAPARAAAVAATAVPQRAAPRSACSRARVALPCQVCPPTRLSITHYAARVQCSRTGRRSRRKRSRTHKWARTRTKTMTHSSRRF